MAKHVIISGASGQLGTVVTESFTKQGWAVSGTALSVRHLPDIFFKEGVNIFPVDLQKALAVEAFLEEAIKLNGPVDALVLLAGGYGQGSFPETDLKQVNDMISVNFITAFHLAKLVYQHMTDENRKGRLVFMGSQSAIEPTSGTDEIAYTISKSMVTTFAQILRASSNGHGIKTLTVVPSIIDTKQNRKAMPKADFAEWVSPADVADKIISYCSGKSMGDKKGILKMYGGK